MSHKEDFEITSSTIDDLSNHYGWTIREKERIEQLVKESMCKAFYAARAGLSHSRKHAEMLQASSAYKTFEDYINGVAV